MTQSERLTSHSPWTSHGMPLSYSEELSFVSEILRHPAADEAIDLTDWTRADLTIVSTALRVGAHPSDVLSVVSGSHPVRLAAAYDYACALLNDARRPWMELLHTCPAIIDVDQAEALAVLMPAAVPALVPPTSGRALTQALVTLRSNVTTMHRLVDICRAASVPTSEQVAAARRALAHPTYFPRCLAEARPSTLSRLLGEHPDASVRI